jgi:hypothetical protein
MLTAAIFPIAGPSLWLGDVAGVLERAIDSQIEFVQQSDIPSFGCSARRTAGSSGSRVGQPPPGS